MDNDRPGSKRKAAQADESDNPLFINLAAKKQKKGDGGASAKRKRACHRCEMTDRIEELTCFFCLVSPVPADEPATDPSSSHPRPPPSKKPKPDSSQARVVGSKPASASRFQYIQDDVNLERGDVFVKEVTKLRREDEEDRERRQARQRSIDPALLASTTTQFQTHVSSPNRTPRPKKTKAKDTLAPITEAETPQIERNRAMRHGDAVHQTPVRKAVSEPPQPGSSGSRVRHSRTGSSSGSRGKRISDAFETPGLIGSSALALYSHVLVHSSIVFLSATS
jgi:hypothetical protein